MTQELISTCDFCGKKQSEEIKDFFWSRPDCALAARNNLFDLKQSLAK